MFARTVNLRLKPKSVAELTQTVDKEIIPLLRKQKGFQDQITFITPGGKEAVGISLWDHKEDAEAYRRGTYFQVQKALAKVVEGTPQLQTYEVSNSTFHTIGARVAATGTRQVFVG